MKSPSRIVTDELLDVLKGHYRLDWNGIHGVKHWARVRTNGLALARETEANPMVVELFAFLHDSCRESEGHDPLHGHRAADLACRLHGHLIRLSATDFDLLVIACRGHTHEPWHPDPTIGTCWDADRLDLTRVDIIPDPALMSTNAGKRRSPGAVH
jgi:uncharacterized protein